MPYFAGKDGIVKLATFEQPTKKWNANLEGTQIDITNTMSPSEWREFLGGFKSGTITLEGPLNPTISPGELSEAAVYDVTIGDNYRFYGDGVLLKISYSGDVEGAAMYSYEVKMTGAPTFENIA